MPSRRANQKHGTPHNFQSPNNQDNMVWDDIIDEDAFHHDGSNAFHSEAIPRSPLREQQMNVGGQAQGRNGYGNNGTQRPPMDSMQAALAALDLWQAQQQESGNEPMWVQLP